MKTRELIEALSKLDPELPILVHGADGGFHDIGLIELENVVFDAGPVGWTGPHLEDSWPAQFDPEFYNVGARQGKAFVLRRK